MNHPCFQPATELAIDYGMLALQPMIGLPPISRAAGFMKQPHPRGFQITGRGGGDNLGVLQLAHAFERETDYRKIAPPGL